jgi:Putative restriction endonuclease
MGDILARPAAPTRRRLNVDAYYRMAEAGILTEPHRVELIDGEIIDMPAIGSPHAAITNRLVRCFARALAIYETALGPEHPDTIRIRDNLANLRRAEGARSKR